MIRIEMDKGLCQMMVDGTGKEVLHDALDIVSALHAYFKNHGCGDAFKAALLLAAYTGSLFDAEGQISENVTDYEDEEMLRAYNRLKDLRDKMQGGQNE